MSELSEAGRPKTGRRTLEVVRDVSHGLHVTGGDGVVEFVQARGNAGEEDGKEPGVGLWADLALEVAHRVWDVAAVPLVTILTDCAGAGIGRTPGEASG